MRIDFNISQTELGKFRTSCETVIRNVGTGTKAATEYAAWDIMSESLEQVPVDTGTLISSSFFGVSRRDDVSSYRYGAVLGYGRPEDLNTQTGLGAIEWIREPTNNVNPKNGHQASTYAARVHEDLDMPHPNGGKAKFLEDPVRNWASGKFARTVMTYWKQAIVYSNRFSHIRYGRGENTRFKRMNYKAANIKFVQHSTGLQRGGEYVRKGEST